MEKYDYYQEVKSDLTDFIKEHFEDYTEQELYDYAIDDDSVTGNASGSYWCNANSAAECLCHNWDLLEDALNCFGYENPISAGEEACDVIIRMYLVQQLWNEVYNRVKCDD